MKNYIDKPDILKWYIDNILLIMRLTTVIFMSSLLQVSASTGARAFNNVRNKSSLIKTFEELKIQTGYNIIWIEKKLDVTSRIDANFKKTNIHNVVDKCSNKHSLSDLITSKMLIGSEFEPLFSKQLPGIFDFIDVQGKVVDENNLPLVGAAVKVKDSKLGTSTNNKGEFILQNVNESSILVITFLGYEPVEVIASKNIGTIKLHLRTDKLKEVEVISTGYQEIPKERATGSFVQINNELFNRAVSPDLLSRLKGVTNGLLVGQNGNLSIRGRSTINSNTLPLIIVDNFPFTGDINTLNPEMIENVTILKDAAAASIWGAFSGNGVIVITTKRGGINQSPIVGIKTDLTIGEKPDLYYQQQLTSEQFIEFEKFLFEKGAYTGTIDDGYSSITPVVAILQAIKIDPSFANQGLAEIEALKSIDYRDQQREYLYRNGTQQRYFVDVKGGGGNQTYYISAGYDKNLPSQVSLSDSRITLKANNTFNLLNDRLRLNADVNFSKSRSDNHLNGRDFTGNVPYEQLADDAGNPLPILISGGLREKYTDTAGSQRLLDWKYRPLDELRNRYSSSRNDLTDYRINIGLSQKIFRSLTLNLNYQYYSAKNELESSDRAESYYTRNLINSYSQIDYTTGILTRPIPNGDIYSPAFQSNQSNYGRGQLNFNQTISSKHIISAIAGYEIRNDRGHFNSYTLYGYNPETATGMLVDPISEFPNFYNGSTSKIGLTIPRQRGSVNRFVSWYGNGSYSYNNKYIISGSIRRDASNLFGVKANQKGVPLWSTGIAWNIHNEDFFAIHWLSLFQIKTTLGYNGNVNNSISAYLTAEPASFNQFNRQRFYKIINPPNENLRWERVKNINAGLFFSTKNAAISGSIELFAKDGLDLIAGSPIAPQTGKVLFTGNTANTSTKGIDIQLNTNNISGNFRWNSTYIFNYVVDKITNYNVEAGNNYNIVSAINFTPLVNYPINAVFGYKWGGLDASGNPQGYLDQEISTDYAKITNLTDVNQLQYFGSKSPNIYGSIRNTFSFKNIDLSFNISYKIGHYFRRNSLDNTLLAGNFKQADYDKRWQESGDELETNVPSINFPAHPVRDSFYQYNSILIEKADHIRLEDIQVSYSIKRQRTKHSKFSNINVYAYASNLGLLWRANKFKLDPEAFYYPTPKAIAFGISTNF